MAKSALTGERSRVRSVRALLAISTALCSGATVSARAQSALSPPIPAVVEENSVDLASALFVAEFPAVGIGHAENGLQGGGRQLRVDKFVNVTKTLTGVGTPTATVWIGDQGYQFSASGGTYTTTKGDGSSLTQEDASYVFTDRDGVRYVFTNTTGYYSNRSIQWPNGERQDFSDSGATTSNNGYQRHYSGNAPQIERFVNLAIDYCDPNGSCPTLTQQWPQLSYSLQTVLNTAGNPSKGSTQTWTIKDGINRTTTVVQKLRNNLTGLMASTTINRPGRANPDTATYNTLGEVRNVTVQGAQSTWTWTWMGASGVKSEAYGAVQEAVRIVRPDGQPEIDGPHTFTFDALGRPDKMTLPGGSTSAGYVQFTYDARGNVTKRTTIARAEAPAAALVEEAGFPAGCTYLASCNKPIWTKDANGNQTNYFYNDTTGQLTQVVAPPSSSGIRPTTTYGYSWLQAFYKNASGVIVASGLPISKLTSISTCRTQATCVGTADELRITYDYGPQTPGVANNLNLVAETRAAGDGSVSLTTTYGYDIFGRRTSEDGPLPGNADARYYRYDQVGRVVGVIGPDPDGTGPLPRAATRTTYDDADNPTLVEQGTVTDPGDAAWAAFASVQQVASTYDANGIKTVDTIKANGAAKAVVQYDMSRDGRVGCRAIRMNSSAWGALPASACTPQTAGPEGPDQITQYQYYTPTILARIDSGIGTADAAIDFRSNYNYTTRRVESVTDANNNTTTYGYDGFDRVTSATYPNGTVDRLGYDANGNVLTKQLRDNQVISLGYNGLNQLVSKDVPNGVLYEYDVAYTYDLLGNLTRSDESNGHFAVFTYDSLGRQLAEESNWTTRRWQYDQAGRRSRLTWGDGFFVSYDYDSASNVVAIRENGSFPLATFEYDGLGRRKKLTHGDGTVTSYGYNDLSQLTSLGLDLAGSAYDLSLGFTYGLSGQMAGRTSSTDAYAFNQYANVDRSYTVNALNQYTSSGSVVPGYDLRGNLTVAGGPTFGYTSENKLASTSTGYALAYDPLGRHYWTSNTAGEVMQYDDDHVIEERVATGVARRYVFGPGVDEPLVWYEGAGTNDRRFLHADERGSIVAVTDAAGNAVAINTYDENGIPGSANIGRFQYTGQTWSPQLGMYDFKARTYSPTLGRFLQPDPTGYADGLNLYDYVGGDPINRTDPTGTRYEQNCYSVSNHDAYASNSSSDRIVVTATYSVKCYLNYVPDQDDTTRATWWSAGRAPSFIAQRRGTLQLGQGKKKKPYGNPISCLAAFGEGAWHGVTDPGQLVQVGYGGVAGASAAAGRVASAAMPVGRALSIARAGLWGFGAGAILIPALAGGTIKLFTDDRCYNG